MRKVRFLVSMAGLSVSYVPGQVYELEDHLAAKLADGVRAVYVDPPANEPDGAGEAADGPPADEQATEDTPNTRRKRG